MAGALFSFPFSARTRHGCFRCVSVSLRNKRRPDGAFETLHPLACLGAAVVSGSGCISGASRHPLISRPLDSRVSSHHASRLAVTRGLEGVRVASTLHPNSDHPSILTMSAVRAPQAVRLGEDQAYPIPNCSPVRTSRVRSWVPGRNHVAVHMRRSCGMGKQGERAGRPQPINAAGRILTSLHLAPFWKCASCWKHGRIRLLGRKRGRATPLY